MAKRICPVVINCPCDDTGLQNTNSEDPDPLIFTGIGYTPAMTYRPQTLGQIDSSAIAQDCYGTAFSVASQLIADLIAEANAIACVTNGDGAGGAPLDPNPTGTTPTVPIPPGVPTPPPTKGRNILKGGGGGGGGGGEPRTSPFNPGSRPTSILPLHHWSCPQDELVPEENVYTLTTSRAGVQYDFKISKGHLPTGITIETISLNSAALKGNALGANPGLYTFTVQATFAGTQPGTTFVAGSVDDTYEVYGLTNNGSVPIIPRNVQFSYQLTAYGQSPLSWYVVLDDFPPGFTMDANGLITGKATNAECGKEYFPIVGYTDAKGRGCVSEVPLIVEGLKFLNDPPEPADLCQDYIDPVTGIDFQFLTDPPNATFTGDVPKCLTLSANGILHGKIKETDQVIFDITAKVSDECTNSKRWIIPVLDPSGDYSCATAIADLVWIKQLTPSNAFAVVNIVGGKISVTMSNFCPPGDNCPDCSPARFTARAFICNPCGGNYTPTFQGSSSCGAGVCTSPSKSSYGSCSVTVLNYGSTIINNTANASISHAPVGNTQVYNLTNLFPIANLTTCGVAAFIDIDMQISAGGPASVTLDLILLPDYPTNMCP